MYNKFVIPNIGKKPYVLMHGRWWQQYLLDVNSSSSMYRANNTINMIYKGYMTSST